MALVDYSDSESESEEAVQPTSKTTAAVSSASTNAKKPIQKVVNRSNPRRILVNLSAASGTGDAKPTENSDEPPAKRARTGGGAFGGFASLLPPPKNPNKSTGGGSVNNSSSGQSAPPRVGINLKTGAAPGFSRNLGDEEEMDAADHKQPSIPEGQKPADEVKLVGKPLMFKPLSVSRKPKKNIIKTGEPKAVKAAAPTSASSAPTIPTTSTQEKEPPKKKVSLFSISAETDEVLDSITSTGTYEPMFEDPTTTNPSDDFAAYDAEYSSAFAQPPTSTSSASVHTATTSQHDTVSALATDLHLSASARRELFGRRGAPDPSQSAARVVNFNTDREYAHNEALRASGDGAAQAFNPVRAIAPGKHSLRQLVGQVQNQREALEESFAKGRSNQNEARARYGWK